MALQDLGYVLRVTLSDTGGNKSKLTYPLQAITWVAAEATAALVLPALDAITDAAVVGYGLSQQFQDDTVLYGGGEVENIASISAKIDALEHKFATIKVPAPVDGVFVAASGPNYNVVDVADVDLQTYLALFVSDIFVSDGELLDSPGTAGNVVGKRIHRGSRKG